MPPSAFFKSLRDFELKHPVEKGFPKAWTNFTSIVITTSLLITFILVVANAALVGYETVTVFRADFNITQSFWYDTFIPGGHTSRTKPGDLCDPHGFNVGNTFTTNYSLFKWDIVSADHSANNSRVGSFAYSGSTLQSCDIDAIYMDAQMISRSADLSATIQCKDVGGFGINATTTFGVGLLKGKYSPPLLGATLEPDEIGADDGLRRAIALNHRLQLARDGFTPLWDKTLRVTTTHPIIISGYGTIHHCSASQVPNDACITRPPRFTIDATTVVLSNATHMIYDSTQNPSGSPFIVEGTGLYNATLNLAQTIIAAVRIDLGQDWPNNVFLHPSVINATLFPTIDDQLRSPLYDETQNMEPLNMTGPSAIQVLYSCPRWQQRKSIGYAVVSVLVATLSMFSSGWASFMFIASCFDTSESTDQYTQVCRCDCRIQSPPNTQHSLQGRRGTW